MKAAGSLHFICICSPEATYDLQNDEMWKNVSTYSNSEAIYSGEIGRLFGVVFVESTEAKVFSQSVHNAVKAATTSSKTFVLKNTPTEAEKEYLSVGGNTIHIGSNEYTLDSETPYDADTNTVKLTEAATLTANSVVWSDDAASPTTGTVRLMFIARWYSARTLTALLTLRAGVRFS